MERGQTCVRPPYQSNKIAVPVIISRVGTRPNSAFDQDIYPRRLYQPCGTPNARDLTDHFHDRQVWARSPQSLILTSPCIAHPLQVPTQPISNSTGLTRADSNNGKSSGKQGLGSTLSLAVPEHTVQLTTRNGKSHAMASPPLAGKQPDCRPRLLSFACPPCYYHTR